MAKTVYEYHPEMDRYLIAPGSIDEYFRFEELFGSRNPVEIEIGVGKGRFILAEARRRPETNFLGIERSLKYLRIALLRQAKDPRPNVRLLCVDADLVVKLLLRPETVTAFHVYFPDPWPRDKHHKRRLFNPRFLEKAAEALIPGGYLYLKSDHEEYFFDAVERIRACGLFETMKEETSQETLEEFAEAEEGVSHYEIKWRLEKKTIRSVDYRVRKGAMIEGSWG